MRQNGSIHAKILQKYPENSARNHEESWNWLLLEEIGTIGKIFESTNRSNLTEDSYFCTVCPEEYCQPQMGDRTLARLDTGTL